MFTSGLYDSLTLKAAANIIDLILYILMQTNKILKKAFSLLSMLNSLKLKPKS